MTFPLMALALALALASTDASATTLLQPGIYRLQPEAYWPATAAGAASDAGPAQAAGEVVALRYEHAVPAAAKLRYAFVSRDRQAQRNTVVFLTDAAYQYDINSANKLCKAYAFPGWNDRSETHPYCRTNIGTDDSEAALDWTTTQFTLRWKDHKRLLRTEHIAAQRTPTAEEAGACAIADVCASEAYGRSINHYQLTRRRDTFVLLQPRDYLDVLYLPAATMLQSRPVVASAGERVAAGSHVAVLARSAGWYQIERIATDGRITRGWIDRDTVLPTRWVTQRARTDRFRFRLGVQRGDDPADPSVLTAIEVLDGATGQRVQVLRDFDSDTGDDGPGLLQLVDANFDGHPDMEVPGRSGGAGPNSTSNLFLFDPRRGGFVHDATLSALPQLSIDPQRRQVTSASRGGCCTHATQRYRYQNGALQLVESREEALSADGTHLDTTHGVLREGRMQYRTVTAPAPPVRE